MAKPKRKIKPAPVPGAAVRKRPHPPYHVPTPENRGKVSGLKACGATHDFIASQIGVARLTLEKYYGTELKAAKDIADTQVVNNLFKQTSKNVAAAIFWLINRKKDEWKQRNDTTHNAGAGFDLERVVNSSMGHGGKDGKK